MAYQLFVDSFDTETFSHASLTELVTSRWAVRSEVGSGGGTGVVISTSSANGRRSSASLRIVNNVTTYGGRANTKAFAASSNAVVGFWLKRTVSANAMTVSFRTNTTTLVTVTIAVDGSISATLGSTTYTSTKYIPATGCYIEIGVAIGNTGSLEVRVNGTATGWLSLPSVDTQPGADTTINNVSIFSGTGSLATLDLDDFYVTYGDELKWLGDVRVDVLALTANATPQDWTPDTGNAWERLNAEAGYITGTTLDDESLFELADYSAATTAIHGVVVNAKARKTDAGSRSFAIEVKSDATTDVGDTIALGDTATEYRQVWLTDPDTATAWTDGGIDALQVGVKVAD